MRFEHVKIRGIGPFVGEVSVDLTAVPGRIVAVAGGNGAGKSTLLEVLAPGVLYRETPTRGSLSSLAQERGAYVEARVVNGATHTIRHVVDAVSGRSETLVLDEAGAPVLADTKVKGFDNWAKAHLPSPEVFFSSVFAAQGSGGFLEMKPGERKQVLSRVLGIEHLERLAERAREQARAAKSRLEIAAARLAELGPVEVATAEGEAAMAEDEAKVAAEKLVQARADAAAAARYRELEGALRAALQQVADLEARIRNNETLLGGAAEIRAAAARIEVIRGELAEVEGTIGAAEARAGGHEARRRDASARALRAQQRARELGARADLARARLRARAEIEAAVASIPAAQAAVTHWDGALALAQAELAEAQAAQLGGAEGRVKALRGHLTTIAEDTEGDLDPYEIAPRALAEDDATAEAEAAAPRRIASAKEAVAEYQARAAEAHRALVALERTAARAGELVAAEAEVAACERDLTAARAEEEAAGADAAAAAREAERERSAAAGARELAAGMRAEIERLAVLAKRLEPLQAAEARIAELRPMLAAAEAQADDARSRLAELPPPVVVDLEAAERLARQTASCLDAARAQVVREKQTAARAAELEVERAAAAEELADLELLSQGLGSSGVPALLIDAAGPELTELVNDLLRTCVGPRWTVSIETTRSSADGKRQLEGCEVRVLDTERGREAGAETFSGGERVLLGEAVSLALSMVACRRAGLEGPTLVRDESGAALDAANGRAWIEMLRRAADIVGASKVLFVAHAPELVAMADARIEIRDGKIEVAA